VKSELRDCQNIMSAEPSENADFPLHLKGEAVPFRDTPFPYISRILHFFDIQRWMALVAEKKLQFFVNCRLKLAWKKAVTPDETEKFIYYNL